MVLILNKKKCSFTPEKTALLTGLFIASTSATILACKPPGHINFHNNSTIPLEITIRRLPESQAHCSLRNSHGHFNKCKDKLKPADLEYKENIIKVPAKKNGKVGKHDNICLSKDSGYLVSYQTRFYDKDKLMEGPSGLVVQRFKDKASTAVIINHTGYYKYIVPKGCHRTNRAKRKAYGASTVCTIDFYKTYEYEYKK